MCVYVHVCVPSYFASVVVEKMKILQELRCASSHLHVFEKLELPKRLHYANNQRIDDIVLMPQDSWLVTW